MKIKFLFVLILSAICSTAIFSQEYFIKNDSTKEFSAPAKEIDSREKIMLGEMDAKSYHGKQGAHFVLGVAFGAIGILGTAVFSNPSPLKDSHAMLLSKNKELFRDPYYLKGYRRKARGQNVAGTAFGTLAFLVFIILVSPH